MVVVGNASRKNHVRSRTLEPSAAFGALELGASERGSGFVSKAMPYG